MEQSCEEISKPLAKYFPFFPILQLIRDLLRFIANIFHLTLWIHSSLCPAVLWTADLHEQVHYLLAFE